MTLMSPGGESVLVKNTSSQAPFSQDLILWEWSRAGNLHFKEEVPPPLNPLSPPGDPDADGRLAKLPETLPY